MRTDGNLGNNIVCPASGFDAGDSRRADPHQSRGAEGGRPRHQVPGIAFSAESRIGGIALVGISLLKHGAPADSPTITGVASKIEAAMGGAIRPILTKRSAATTPSTASDWRSSSLSISIRSGIAAISSVCWRGSACGRRPRRLGLSGQRDGRYLDDAIRRAQFLGGQASRHRRPHGIDRKRSWVGSCTRRTPAGDSAIRAT